MNEIRTNELMFDCECVSVSSCGFKISIKSWREAREFISKNNKDSTWFITNPNCNSCKEYGRTLVKSTPEYNIHEGNYND